MDAGIRPLVAEYHWTKFTKTFKVGHLDEAVKYDPLNTIYNYAGAASRIRNKLPFDAEQYLYKAEQHFNGDVVLWSVYALKARFYMGIGNVYGAKKMINRAIYYWPDYIEGRAILEKINEYERKILARRKTK
jgi:hypothetical protein